MTVTHPLVDGAHLSIVATEVPFVPATELDRALVELEDRIAEATDPIEIAVVLEAAGIGDAVAQRRYGSVDVLDLANRLRRIIPERISAPEVDLSAHFGPLRVSLVQGASFVFAGIMTMAITGMVSHPLAGPVMIGSSILGTVMMGWMSYLGHTVTQRVATDDRGASIATLFCAGIATAVLIGIVVGVAVDPLVGLLGAVPIVYAVGAVTELVLDRYVRFAVVMFPGGIACVVYLLVPHARSAELVALVLSAAGFATLGIGAAIAVRPNGSRPSGAGRIDIRSGAATGVSGLATAGLVAAVVVTLSGMSAMGVARARGWFLLALAFFVPLAFATTGVALLRRRAFVTLSRSAFPSDLRRTAHRSLAALWAAHLVIGGGCIVVAVRANPVGDSHLSALIATAFLIMGLMLVAGLITTEPAARSAVAALEFAVLAVLAVTAVTERGAPSESVAVLVVSILGVGLIPIAACTWRDAGRLSAYRWSL